MKNPVNGFSSSGILAIIIILAQTAGWLVLSLCLNNRTATYDNPIATEIDYA